MNNIYVNIFIRYAGKKEKILNPHNLKYPNCEDNFIFVINCIFFLFLNILQIQT